MKKVKAGGVIVRILLSLLILAILASPYFAYKWFRQFSALGDMSAYETLKTITAEEEGIALSAAVIRDWSREYRLYGRDAREYYMESFDYEIGSISKTFLGMLLTRAALEGKIDLKASVDRYLDLEGDKYYPTIERLVTHTSGCAGNYFDIRLVWNSVTGENPFYGVSKERIIEQLEKLELEDKDYEFEYSNFGFALLGLVLEEVYDQNFTDLMNDFNTNELRLEDTAAAVQSGNMSGYWSWDEDDAYIPAGAIISDIEAMADYLSLCLYGSQDYALESFELLKRVSTGNTLSDRTGVRIDEVACSWMFDAENNFLWHNGGTGEFSSYIAFSREQGVGVVLLVNRPADSDNSLTVLGAKLMRELLSGECSLLEE